MSSVQIDKGTDTLIGTSMRSTKGRGGSPQTRPTWLPHACALLLLLTALSVLYCFLPLASAIKIGSDEDFALSKALLSFKGYKMYIDFWNDQPPLHTFLLKFIFAHVSFSVLAARLLTVISTLLLLSFLFVLVSKLNGLLTAILTTLLLIASPGFLELSASAMVELPGLAPVIAALCLIRVAPIARGQRVEILAGLVFAIALQIKLIGALYLPLVLLLLWTRSRQSPNPLRHWLVSGLSFGTAMLLGFFLLQFLTGEALTAEFAQSRASHFSTTKSFEYGSPADHPFDWTLLLKHWDATVPALIGIFLIARRKVSPGWILPCSWMVLTLAAFSSFKPFWSYYYVHAAVPLCWLGAMGIAAAWQYVRSAKRRTLYGIVAICSACAFAWMIARVYLQARDICDQPRTYSNPALAEIKRYKPFASFIWATEPVFAFHADMPIPPRIATLSLKRFWTGDMTDEQLVEQMRILRPEIVLLTLNTRPCPFQLFLNSDYRLVYGDPQHQLYVLPKVVEQADPWPGN